MKVAVVGPTGVLGRALVPLLIQDGHAVLALARSPQKVSDLFGGAVDAVECDLLTASVDTLSRALDGCDAVLHIATAIPDDMTRADAWVANTRLRTDGVRALLDATLNAGVERYLQQSITMAYPDCGDAWITEDQPLDSTPQRATTTAPVIEMEAMIRRISGAQLCWCILRGGLFVGHRTFQERAIDQLKQGTAVIAGDGGAFQSFIHVEDMASATAAALNAAPAGSTYNVVAEPLRQREYLEQLADAVGAPRPPYAADAAPLVSQRCSNLAARQALQWQPAHGIIPAAPGA